MKLHKMFVILSAFVAICSCIAQQKGLTDSNGRIAIAVYGERHCCRRSSISPKVGVTIENLVTGEITRRIFEFEEGKRVDYFEDLAPGRYLIKEDDANIFSLRSSRPEVVVQVRPGQTVKATVYVHIRVAVYPIGGLYLISDKDFWENYE